MVDLYKFRTDAESPYRPEIQAIQNPYRKLQALEEAISKDIGHPRFISYVQMHEFESLLMIKPDRLSMMYPEQKIYREVKT